MKTNRLKRLYLSNVLLLLFIVVTVESQSADVEVNYDGTAVPNLSSPAWNLSTISSTNSTATANGILTIETPNAADFRIYEMVGPTRNWNGIIAEGVDKKLVIETRVKALTLESGASASGLLYFSNGKKDYRIFFLPNRLHLGSAGGAGGGVDIAEGVFHTYHFELSKTGELKVYLNNGANPAISGYFGTSNVTSNKIYFGDGSMTVGGKVEYDYLNYTGGAAPEFEVSNIPAEILLAGSSRVQEGHPIDISYWASKPAKVPNHYEGGATIATPDSRLEIKFKKDGGIANVFEGDLEFFPLEWKKVVLPSNQLDPGNYTVTVSLFYDNIEYSRATKRISILTANEVSLTQRENVLHHLNEGSGYEMDLSGFVEADKDYAVYGTFKLSSPEMVFTISGRQTTIPASRTNYRQREFFLGYKEGNTHAGSNTNTSMLIDMGVSQAGTPDYLKTRPYFLRFRVTQLNEGEVALIRHFHPTNSDKEVVVNNDGFSEGFGKSNWQPSELPAQVNRYRSEGANVIDGSSVTQLDYSAFLTEVVNFRMPEPDSSDAYLKIDLLGDDIPVANQISPKWEREDDQFRSESFRLLADNPDESERLFPKLISTGQAINLPVWGSLRMGGSYGNGKYSTIFNGRYWFENPSERVNLSREEYFTGTSERRLSLAYTKVQDRRIAVLSRLAQLGCKGVNLDYCRYPRVMGYDQPLMLAYQAEHGLSGGPVNLSDQKWKDVRIPWHNRFIREVKKEMNKVGVERGEKVSVSVRFPATKYQSFGFDPRHWVGGGLVHTLIPGFPGHDRWFDAAPFVTMVKDNTYYGKEAKLLINMSHIRHTFGSTSELTDAEKALGLKHGRQVKNKRADYFRRAAECYALNVNGMYFFNNWEKPKVFYGLNDSTYVKRWNMFENTDHLDSAVSSID